MLKTGSADDSPRWLATGNPQCNNAARPSNTSLRAHPAVRGGALQKIVNDRRNPEEGRLLSLGRELIDMCAVVFWAILRGLRIEMGPLQQVWRDLRSAEDLSVTDAVNIITRRSKEWAQKNRDALAHMLSLLFHMLLGACFGRVWSALIVPAVSSASELLLQVAMSQQLAAFMFVIYCIQFLVRELSLAWKGPAIGSAKFMWRKVSRGFRRAVLAVKPWFEKSEDYLEAIREDEFRKDERPQYAAFLKLMQRFLRKFRALFSPFFSTDELLRHGAPFDQDVHILWKATLGTVDRNVMLWLLSFRVPELKAEANKLYAIKLNQENEERIKQNPPKAIMTTTEEAEFWKENEAAWRAHINEQLCFDLRAIEEIKAERGEAIDAERVVAVLQAIEKLKAGGPGDAIDAERVVARAFQHEEKRPDRPRTNGRRQWEPAMPTVMEDAAGVQGESSVGRRVEISRDTRRVPTLSGEEVRSSSSVHLNAPRRL